MNGKGTPAALGLPLLVERYNSLRAETLPELLA